MCEPVEKKPLDFKSALDSLNCLNVDVIRAFLDNYPNNHIIVHLNGETWRRIYEIERNFVNS